jgi:hypothetical protein
MITSVATLLRELMDKEAAKLKQQNITHGPTIGAMYEGLTRDILDRAIPTSLHLHIVEGFIEDAQGQHSPQIDVMLVAGEGRQLPYTDSYVWPIQNVIAVIEVKKNLFGTDLDDAFRKLRCVMQMHVACLQTSADGPPNMPLMVEAFARLTGYHPLNGQAVDALPRELSGIFHTLFVEHLAPVRVIFGYEGYTDEFSLRNGLFKYLEDHMAMPAGFGIGSLPDLIVCRRNTLLKMTGRPYISPMVDGWWLAIVSNNENPLRMLIELIWTRLSYQFQQQFPMDDTLQMERLAPAFFTRVAERDGRIGWEYRFHDLTRKRLSAIEPTSWKPTAIDQPECMILLLVSRLGELDVRDANFRLSLIKEGIEPDPLIARLVERRMLAWSDDHTVRLMKTVPWGIGFTPHGEMHTTNEADLLDLWLRERR